MIADHVEVGSYGDVDAAVRMAAGCAVVTYELEHVDARLVEAIEAARGAGPSGLMPLAGDPGPAGRAPVRRRPGYRGRALAGDSLRAMTRRSRRPWSELGLACPDQVGVRWLRRPFAGPGRVAARPRAGLDGPRSTDRASRCSWSRSSQFAAELSVVCARSARAGSSPPIPVARNVHDDGILVESVTARRRARPRSRQPQVDRRAAWPRRWTWWAC